MTLHITKQVRDSIGAHGERGYPHEICAPCGRFWRGSSWLGSWVLLRLDCRGRSGGEYDEDAG